MGGTPTQHHTRGRVRRGRSHQALKPRKLASCLKCGSPVLPHHVCDFCGTYNKHQFVDVLAKLDKKERKKREKEQVRRERETAEARSEKTGELNPEEMSHR